MFRGLNINQNLCKCINSSDRSDIYRYKDFAIKIIYTGTSAYLIYRSLNKLKNYGFNTVPVICVIGSDKFNMGILVMQFIEGFKPFPIFPKSIAFRMMYIRMGKCLGYLPDLNYGNYGLDKNNNMIILDPI